MPLHSINYMPLAAKYVASRLLSRNKTVVIFDIGARSGAPSYWDCLENAVKIIGFEPDETECKILNRAFNSKNHEYYPIALHEQTGEKCFFITKNPSCSGFEKVDPVFCGRFPTIMLNNTVEKTIRLKTTSVDDFVKSKKIGDISFLKIDVEGSELAVLRGARDALSSKKVLGILVEVWWEKSFKDCPPFSELDSYLREMGFHFYDLSLNYNTRNSLPAGKICIRQDENDKNITAWSSSEKRGQANAGEALYFRDPIRELTVGPKFINWDDDTFLKLVALFDIFNYGDCAIELLDFCRNRFIKSVDVDNMYDLLIPEDNGMRLPYDKYFDLSKKIIEKKYKEVFWVSEEDLKNIQRPEYNPPLKKNIESIPTKVNGFLNAQLQDDVICLDDKNALFIVQEEVSSLRERCNILEEQLNVLRDIRNWTIIRGLFWLKRTLKVAMNAVKNKRSRLVDN